MYSKNTKLRSFNQYSRYYKKRDFLIIVICIYITIIRLNTPIQASRNTEY